MRFKSLKKLLAAATLVGCLLAIPATASAATYQYGCCSTSNGVTLKTTDGWKARSTNNRNTPAGNYYCLWSYIYDGSSQGSYFSGDCDDAGADGVDTLNVGGYNSRQECQNLSGAFLINVSCWTIQ